MASKAARDAANRISETVAFMTTDDEATAAAIIDDALREEREAGDRLVKRALGVIEDTKSISLSQRLKADRAIVVVIGDAFRAHRQARGE
jgi:hypothetical protein